MSVRLPVWSRLLLALVLVLQAVLPIHVASAPPNAERAEQPRAPTTRISAALADRLAGLLRHDPAVTSAAPFTSPLPTPPPTPVPVRTAPLALTMQAAPAWAAVDETVTFTVTAANAGRAPLAGLVLSDMLPAGLVYVAQSATGFAYAADDQRLTWPPRPWPRGPRLPAASRRACTGWRSAPR